jgi:threo-3-hydroxy-L-aspartate ammonia-lyase
MTLSIQDIYKAHSRIAPFIRKTPLIRAYAFETLLNSSCRIFFKCEHLQITNSFKLRGAFNALLKLSQEQREKGVITRSSGNFAQALSFASLILHIPSWIIMPPAVPSIKRELTEKYKAHIILYGNDHIEQQKKVQELAIEKGLTPLSPYDHPDVIEGQGTIALEIYEDLPSITHFFCPIGGGGLSGGTATAFKGLSRSIHTIGIEPIEANDYYLSRQKGMRIKNQHTHTIADGLRAPQVGDCNWPLLQSYLDDVQCISEKQIKRAMYLLYKYMGLVIEPSGATSVAGLLNDPLPSSGDLVCVLSGGNVDPEDFEKWIKEGQDYD